MAYISLYRKYRSQTFDDVIGQDHVVKTIGNAIRSGKIGQAYLFCGSRGTGKTTVARLIAKALNCTREDSASAEPCNECEACKEITAGSAVDVIEMDAASNRGVLDMAALREGVLYPPMYLRYKVYIIDEVHQLSGDAKDAFLKTLEEPPAHVVFILATTEAHKIPITIRSRCQQFDFRRGGVEEIAGRIRYVVESEGAQIDEGALELLARTANGSYRDSLSLLEQVLAFTQGQITLTDVNDVLGILDEDALLEIGSVIADSDSARAFVTADKLLREGRDVQELAKSASEFFRDVLMLKTGADTLRSQDSRWTELAKRFSQPELVHIIQVFAGAEKELRWTEQHRLALEMALLSAMAKPVSAPAQPVRQAVSQPVSQPAARTAPPAVRAKSAPVIESPIAAPTATAQAAAETSSALQSGPLTLLSLEKQWPRIILRLKKELRKTGLAALLANGSLVSLNDNVLDIGFTAKYEFHRKGVEKDTAVIAQAIQDITGADIRVRANVIEETPPTQPAPEPVQSAVELEHPLTDDVMVMFGGEFVNDDESDPWKE